MIYDLARWILVPFFSPLRKKIEDFLGTPFKNMF